MKTVLLTFTKQEANELRYYILLHYNKNYSKVLNNFRSKYSSEKYSILLNYLLFHRFLVHDKQKKGDEVRNGRHFHFKYDISHYDTHQFMSCFFCELIDGKYHLEISSFFAQVKIYAYGFDVPRKNEIRSFFNQIKDATKKQVFKKAILRNYKIHHKFDYSEFLIKERYLLVSSTQSQKSEKILWNFNRNVTRKDIDKFYYEYLLPFIINISNNNNTSKDKEDIGNINDKATETEINYSTEVVNKEQSDSNNWRPLVGLDDEPFLDKDNSLFETENIYNSSKSIQRNLKDIEEPDLFNQTAKDCEIEAVLKENETLRTQLELHHSKYSELEAQSSSLLKRINELERISSEYLELKNVHNVLIERNKELERIESEYSELRAEMNNVKSAIQTAKEVFKSKTLSKTISLKILGIKIIEKTIEKL